MQSNGDSFTLSAINDRTKVKFDLDTSLAIRTIIFSLQVWIHNWARRKGFWEGDESKRNDGEIIALIHSELSEALEALRHGNPPDEHCSEFTSVAIEMADTVIRILDYCEARDIDLGAAILAKMAYNEGREHKHGKRF